MTDRERMVEVMASRLSLNLPKQLQYLAKALADDMLSVAEDAGFDVYRPDDCMELEACAHCVTASIPLEHRMEAFYLVPVGGDS